MGFHDVRFPDDISYGSIGGPGFKTDVIVLDSGAEQRVARWNQGRRRYNVSYGIKKHAQLTDLIEFYVARRGVANGFRYRDFLDCTTSPTGLAPELGGDQPGSRDHIIGTGDGIKVDFQLLKRYSSGLQNRVRNITKPVALTTVINVGGADQGAGFTVNSATGIVTFNSFNAPDSGLLVRAGCQFDVPVRFGVELDEMLPASIDTFGTGSVPDIPLVEVVDPIGVQEDEFYFGGAVTTSLTADITLSLVGGRVVVLDAVSNFNVRMPDKGTLPGGGPYFYIVNNGTSPLTLTDSSGDGGATIVTMQAPSSHIMVLAKGPDTWYAV